MKEYELADVRFNNGGGALLCNECLIIIADGFEHEDRVHLCEECLLKREREAVKKMVGILDGKERMNIKFPERYEEQHMKTIQLVDEQVDGIVIQELKSMYDGLAENLLSRKSNTGYVYMDHDKNKDIAIMRDMLRSISMVLDYMGVQYGE